MGLHSHTLRSHLGVRGAGVNLYIIDSGECAIVTNNRLVNSGGRGN